MSDRTKVKIAYAEAIAQTMWIKGLISTKERDAIAKKSREKLRGGNC